MADHKCGAYAPFAANLICTTHDTITEMSTHLQQTSAVGKANIYTTHDKHSYRY
jgi:hypothetical protein